MAKDITLAVLQTRLQQAQAAHKKRNALIRLCRQMYMMTRQRDGEFLGSNSNWRREIPDEFYESSSRPHNTANLATAVLSGHYPQFRVAVPGIPNKDLTSRAEKFIQAVLRINSRKQGDPLHQLIAFKTCLDGGVGIRVTWDPTLRPTSIETIPDTDQPGEDRALAYYPPNDLPVVIDVISLNKLYPVGRGPRGQPFREIFQVESMTAEDVFSMWEGVEGAKTDQITGLENKTSSVTYRDYVEWWGWKDGKVWQAIIYDKKFVVEPRETGYPTIPYVISKYLSLGDVDPEESWQQYIPFFYSIIWTVEREEFLRSRMVRNIDMILNMLPIHQGTTPVQLSGAWGELVNVDERDKITFPQIPGNSPDVVRYLEEVMARESEGTFSQAMFGQVSSRLSGYGLSQLIGTDTLRTDLPRNGLELALGNVADLIFALLREFSYGTAIAAVAQVRNISLSSYLSGLDTLQLVVEAFIKPKQPSDEMRLATLGAQLASLPGTPVSAYYILEHFFGITQPEDEMAAKLSEDAMADPVIKLMAIQQALVDAGNPYAGLVQQQLMSLMQPQMPQGGIQGVGMGMPQAWAGNPPPALAMGLNPLEEGQPNIASQAAVSGGPLPEGF